MNASVIQRNGFRDDHHVVNPFLANVPFNTP